MIIPDRREGRKAGRPCSRPRALTDPMIREHQAVAHVPLRHVAADAIVADSLREPRLFFASGRFVTFGARMGDDG